MRSVLSGPYWREGSSGWHFNDSSFVLDLEMIALTATGSVATALGSVISVAKRWGQVESATFAAGGDERRSRIK